jgi:hypothetical protein
LLLLSLPLLLARGALLPLESLLAAEPVSVEVWLPLLPPEAAVAAVCISGGMFRCEWSGTRSSSMLQGKSRT